MPPLLVVCESTYRRGNRDPKKNPSTFCRNAIFHGMLYFIFLGLFLFYYLFLSCFQQSTDAVFMQFIYTHTIILEI